MVEIILLIIIDIFSIDREDSKKEYQLEMDSWKIILKDFNVTEIRKLAGVNLFFKNLVANITFWRYYFYQRYGKIANELLDSKPANVRIDFYADYLEKIGIELHQAGYSSEYFLWLFGGGTRQSKNPD